MVKRGHTKNYVLDEPRRRALAAACDSLEERVIALAPLYLGLRVSELAHLRADWVIGDKLRVPVRQPCGCRDCAKKGGVWKPKTAKSARELVIPGLLKDDLRELLRAQPDGLGMSRHTLRLRLKGICHRANIRVAGLGEDTVFPHVLRATCATMLAAGNMNAVQLMYYMGWTNLKTAQAYIDEQQAKDGAQDAAKHIFGGD